MTTPTLKFSSPRERALVTHLEREILIIDGAMGTMLQRHRLEEHDYRGDRFGEEDYPRPQQGNNDLLSLSQPVLIEEIHRAYLDAGAQIIETNSFNSNAPSQSDYGTEALVYELNLAAAQLARRAIDAFLEEQLGGKGFNGQHFAHLPDALC